MTTLTHSTDSHRTAAKPHFVSQAAASLAIWSAAAAFVAMAHWTFEPLSPAASFAAKGTVILLAAFAYVRFAGVRTTIAHALLIGAAWVFLDIVTELTISATTGHSWFALLGSPARPYWRYALLFTWIAAPALFAHHE